MSRISHSGNTLKINGKEVRFDHEITEVFEVRDMVIVFLNPDADTGETEQYRNLIAVAASGQKLWKAELPTSKASDVYWKVSSKDPLVAYSFSSYECEIDLATGKVLTLSFYK